MKMQLLAAATVAISPFAPAAPFASRASGQEPDEKSVGRGPDAHPPGPMSGDLDAFYAGWPNVFSALPVAKDVFEERPH